MLFHGEIREYLVEIHLFSCDGIVHRLHREGELDPFLAGKLGVNTHEFAAGKELVTGLGEDVHTTQASQFPQDLMGKAGNDAVHRGIVRILLPQQGGSK